LASIIPPAGVILTDTHCHLDMDRFDADRGSVIERALQAGVRRILVPSLDAVSAARITALVNQHSSLFAAVGIHPTSVDSLWQTHISELQLLAAARKVVAIGEIGLDYYWVQDVSKRKLQRDALRGQLHLAEACGLPVILHMREHNDATDGSCAADLLRLLDDWVSGLRSRDSDLAERPGVLHSFAGSLDTANAAIGLGFCIGVTGPVTYARAEGRRELVRRLPPESLLIETDAPFLAPEPHRGRRNEPAYVAAIADRIAAVQSRTPSDVATTTSRSAARLFAWGDPD
jgi:TatD DNase family protein